VSEKKFVLDTEKGGYYCTLLCNTPITAPLCFYCLQYCAIIYFPRDPFYCYCNKILAISCKGQHGGEFWIWRGIAGAAGDAMGGVQCQSVCGVCAGEFVLKLIKRLFIILLVSANKGKGTSTSTSNKRG